ncbi:hypothetical protein EQG49_10250 [Periweissella cryptocerci]|uniref:Uncharacterized protein n=1 Tax=Periweissella cryptocerci TaxID=2506420 RepID=A0A4V1AIV4_9LACO|nr:hypothetical protein [Periweissella cryptocerci]QBO36815.1 hypothetical protein EQG49_10250 [Periweissella cryptocerci]
MSIVAGTIAVIQDGMPYYLVVNNDNHYDFFTAKMHAHEGDTALGALLAAMEPHFVIDDLRLDELTSVTINDKLSSLFVFTTTDFAEVQLDSTNFEFVQASGLHSLLETVDMGTAPQLL